MHSALIRENPYTSKLTIKTPEQHKLLNVFEKSSKGLHAHSKLDQIKTFLFSFDNGLGQGKIRLLPKFRKFLTGRNQNLSKFSGEKSLYLHFSI